jgi:integrase/recombinase XerD
MVNWKPYIKQFLTFLKLERGLSDNTIKSYALDLKRIDTYLINNELDFSPKTITEEQLRDYLYTTSESLQARSRARLISTLKGFFNYLVLEDILVTSPMELIELPKIGRKLPDTLSTKEIDNLINAIDLHKEGGERNRAMLEMLYSCGLRVSELVGLQISDLFFDEGFIRVTGKGNKQRFVPIDNRTIGIVNLYINYVRVHQPEVKPFQDTLFLNRRGKQLTRAMVFTVIKNLASDINLEKNISPHTFRHSFASHLLQNGADLRSIQTMLGHESITTTEIYMHIDRSFLKEVIDKYHPHKNKT